jgi:hypothetical protein
VVDLKKLILTFDVEDFINGNENSALYSMLKILADHHLRALFFITGHVAEKLSAFPKIIYLLEDHEIGFHSSGHSVHPTIPEYTDVEKYEIAYKISLERETSYINPLSGKIDGSGGIYSLQNTFKSKKIQAFRAPGMCWTPPHLEALMNIGIKFDFSSNVTYSKPVKHKGVTFYPYTFMQSWDGSLQDYECLGNSLLKRDFSIINLHPTLFVNNLEWDSIYYERNPKSLSHVPHKLPKESNFLLKNLNLLLKRVSTLQRANLLETNPDLCSATTDLKISTDQVEKVYSWSMRWPRNRFHYKPVFIRHHFHQFFESAICRQEQ